LEQNFERNKIRPLINHIIFIKILIHNGTHYYVMDTIKGWKKPYQKYDFWMSKSNSEIVKVVFDEKYSIWTVRTEHKSIYAARSRTEARRLAIKYMREHS